MSVLALSLSILAVAASLGVAVLAWHAMARLDDDLNIYASFEFMRLDNPRGRMPDARPPGASTTLPDPPQGFT